MKTKSTLHMYRDSSRSGRAHAKEKHLLRGSWRMSTCITTMKEVDQYYYDRINPFPDTYTQAEVTLDTVLDEDGKCGDPHCSICGDGYPDNDWYSDWSSEWEYDCDAEEREAKHDTYLSQIDDAYGKSEHDAYLLEFKTYYMHGDNHAPLRPHHDRDRIQRLRSLLTNTHMKSRTQYVAGEVSHQDYYAQFVTPSILRVVGECSIIGERRIKASKDPHFNDIPLRLWDDLQGIVMSLTGHLRIEAGEGNSLSVAVCIAKAAAHIIKNTP